MPETPLAVLGVGLVSGLALTGEESCAAIRCGINNFQETRFIGSNGDWLVGSAVKLDEPWRGITKLGKMAARAISECLTATDEPPGRIPVLLCVAEPERPGRLEGLERVILECVERELGLRLHPHSRVIEQGRVGGPIGLRQAWRMLAERRHTRAILAGVDSFLVGPTLAAYDREDRLRRRDNSNGFIPGEAGGAMLLGLSHEGIASPLSLRGLGFAREPAPFGSGRPSRADGLVSAVRTALADAGVALKDCDHRIADVNGEQYRFKEAALAITRLLRDRKTLFSLWHATDCIGEVGAAAMPAMVAMLFTGARKGYLPGPLFLGHLGNDDEKRAAFVAQATVGQDLALEVAAESEILRAAAEGYLMANEVYANGREIACKAASGKSIAAFPDTCLSPPSPPAGPVPLPYPNTANASDTTNGSKTVMISGQEVMLKDQSTFKKSTGDEAATKSLGMGVVTHALQGEASFVAWSMDVKIEGQNVDRHMDQMIHNEQCSPANTPPWVYMDAAATTPIQECDKEVAAKQTACEDKGLSTRSEQCGDADCNKARKCLLVSKRQGDRGSESTKVGCCDGEQPHHMIEGHGLRGPGGTKSMDFPYYVYDDAPCVCADGDRHRSEHGDMHQSVGRKETAAVRKAAANNRSPDFAWNYAQAKSAAINAHQKVFRAGCRRDCLEAQLDSYHNDVGCHDRILLRTYDVEAAGGI